MSRKSKQEEYYQFVEWCAKPSSFRKASSLPKTQKQLAQELAVSEVVLSKWKNKETFDEDVKLARVNWGRSLTSEVIYALYLRGTGQSKRGNVEAINLWIDLVEPDWNKQDGEYEPEDVGY
jgi:hypothetical protein